MLKRPSPTPNIPSLSTVTGICVFLIPKTVAEIVFLLLLSQNGFCLIKIFCFDQ
jgi:hypothetical protein